jgi:AcrR family transcriptional regulator
MKGSTKVGRRRSYRLGRRGEAAEETRRRIVAATFELHNEQGIAGTTMSDIAERAGVSVGTVYHHFPSYPDAIAACGVFVAETLPPPSAAIFEGARTRAERIERLARAWFQFYERLPGLASVRRDQHLADSLKGFAEQETRLRLALAAKALGLRETDRRAAVLAALVDLDAANAFRRYGLGLAEAADTAAALADAWLDSPAAKRTRSSKR